MTSCMIDVEQRQSMKGRSSLVNQIRAQVEVKRPVQLSIQWGRVVGQIIVFESKIITQRNVLRYLQKKNLICLENMKSQGPTFFKQMILCVYQFNIYTYTPCLKINCTNCLCQNFVKLSINFNNLWQVDDRIAKVLYHIYIFHLTSLISPHYLVKHKKC